MAIGVVVRVASSDKANGARVEDVRAVDVWVGSRAFFSRSAGSSGLVSRAAGDEQQQGGRCVG